MIYSWQEQYICVLLETDPPKVYARILEARSAFEQRRLSRVVGEELRAIGVAVGVLDELERKTYGVATNN